LRKLRGSGFKLKTFRRKGTVLSVDLYWRAFAWTVQSDEGLRADGLSCKL